jgi:hypothetical protein
MAVCGRCWICGTKFSCDETDEGAYVTVSRDGVGRLFADTRSEKICTACVGVIDGDLPGEGPCEPHGDGMPARDRLAGIIALLATVADARAQRKEP